MRKNSLSYFLYRFKYRFAKELRLTRPVDISLELSSRCNQRCGYCYHSDQANLPFSLGFMTYETAALIIADAALLGVNSLKFNFRGEGTLNPDFSRILNLAKDHAKDSTFIDRILNSNFKFSNDNEELFEALCTLTKVKISFDSFNADVMHAQRAGSVHSLALKNIDKFYNHPNRKNTKIVIQAVRTKLNKDEDIYGMAKARWPDCEVSIRDAVSGRVNKDVSSFVDRKRDFSNRQSCIQAFARIIFAWNGNAQMCCPDTGSNLVIGNIHDKPIYEIFNSVKAKNIRKSLRDKTAFSMSPCNNCSSYESFKGYSHPWGS
jgi:radical SAM protein with 4Fe4S-binding SPASM domain